MVFSKTRDNSLGLLISTLLVVIAAIGWLPSYDFSGLSIWHITAVFMAKVGAFGGLAMFAVSLIISSKTTLLDGLFGGLDKMYKIHRLFGTGSVLLLIMHPIGLSLLRVDKSWPAAFLWWFNVGNLPVFLGTLSLFLLIGFVLWSMYARVRHETFIVVHRVLAIIFLAGVSHAFITGSIIAESTWLKSYLLILTFVASGFYIVYTLLDDVLLRPYNYIVHSVRKKPDGIVELVLEPVSRILRFSPGQFAYVRLFSDELQEYHPFSIASGSSDRQLRFVVRKSGDFTRALTSVHKGNNVQVKGPYGGFTFFDKRYKKQLWIAGGIGVTPFLSKARSLPVRHRKGNIEMIYATADKHPYGIQELERIEHHNPQFNVTLFHQDKFGFVNLQLLIEHLNDVHERAIFVCGPPPLLKAVVAEAEKLGMSHQLHYEEFSY